MAENRIDCYCWVPKAEQFSPALLYIHPDDPNSTRELRVRLSAPAPRVCVIGGGIAGLTAAYELVARKCDVTVLEASDRFGGRIDTWHFADGTYGELGAMRIPDIHGCVMHYIKRLDLDNKLRKFTKANPAGILALRDHLVPYRRWKELRDVYPWALDTSEPTRHQESEWIWKQDPSKTFDNLLNQLWKWDMGWDFFDPDSSTTRVRRAEQATLWQALCASKVIGWPAGASGFPPISDDTWGYLRRATAAAGVEQATLMEAIVDSFPFTEATMWRLDGGMDELIRAFIAAIRDSEHCVLRLNSPVTDIRIGDDGVTVEWRDGSLGGRPESGSFDYAFCTAPAPCVQRIRFHAQNDPTRADRAEGLASITYGSAAKTLIHVRRRLWENPRQTHSRGTDAAILGGASFTDLPIQQVWYPSDGAEEVKPESFSAPADDGNSEALPTAYRIESEGYLPAEIDPGMLAYVERASNAGFDHPSSPSESWRRPGVLTAAYIWGSTAKRLAVLTDTERSQVVLDALESLHPGISKEIDETPVHRIWDCQMNPGDGAYALFAPGEASRYQRALSEPVRDVSGTARVYFAGEHLAIAHGWIQSSMQTALACVMHLLDGLP